MKTNNLPSMVYIKKNVNNLIIKILQSTSIRLHNVLVAHSNRYNEPGAMQVSHLSDALCLVDVPMERGTTRVVFLFTTPTFESRNLLVSIFHCSYSIICSS